ncbi:MAG: 50S ribosomal protein L11 methyltransferase [Alphaproteobacteria bacterium]|nr:50S ribosomal protein L11 methyltransferase [Alphaproteobacteria bacterium]
MTEDLTQYQTVITIPEKAVPFFEKALDPYAVALMASLIEKGEDKNKWKMEAIFDGKPDENVLDVTMAIAAMSAEIDEPEWDLLPVPKKNWLRENLLDFPPLELGKYYIYGSHIENPRIPKGMVALQIDAATAFGSGEHATTQGCLQAFEDVLKTTKPKRVLDMGCGSGILSMAAAKVLGKDVKIDAVDIDPESVRVTKENIKINGVEKNIKVFQSEGYANVTDQYDLIFANILARPLMEMAPDLYKHLNAGGMAILSGFLNGQKSWVLRAHAKAGLEFVRVYKIKEWSTAIVKRN